MNQLTFAELNSVRNCGNLVVHEQCVLAETVTLDFLHTKVAHHESVRLLLQQTKHQLQQPALFNVHEQESDFDRHKITDDLDTELR